jgi:hypothetical protein
MHVFIVSHIGLQQLQISLGWFIHCCAKRKHHSTQPNKSVEMTTEQYSRVTVTHDAYRVHNDTKSSSNLACFLWYSTCLGRLIIVSHIGLQQLQISLGWFIRCCSKRKHHSTQPNKSMEMTTEQYSRETVTPRVQSTRRYKE